MSLADKISRISTSGLARNAYGLYFVPWMTANSYIPLGTNIFDEDWDLAVILDACRVDALREVQDDYPFINEVNAAISVGSSSKEWMVNTFRQEYIDTIDETIYLTGNAWADVVLREDVSFSSWTVMKGTIFDRSRFVEKLLYRPTVTRTDFEKVIIQSLTDMNGIEAFCAEELTDYAIHVGRNYGTERVLVHYMQPHEPYVHRVSKGEEPMEVDRRPIDHLQGGHDREPIWDAYLDNLRYVLGEVERLLENFDGEALITADHGEMFGEWNLHGHGEGILHPHLKRVPWVRATANDTHKDEVEVSFTDNADQEVQQRLSALGYT